MLNKILISCIFFINLYAQTPLEYLNEHRINAGMIPYQDNSLLKQSSYNHAKYLVKNRVSGHYESPNSQYFTGETPSDRAFHVNYQSSIGENLTVGFFSYKESIDALFTAIYHRFGFLNFDDDEIGIGMEVSDDKTIESRVYNLGNSNLSNLCNGVTYSGSGVYYYNVCKDQDFKIEESEYNNAKKVNALMNSDVIVWPYVNQQDFKPVFYEESPDPLPDCSVTGNPISIQFNEIKTGNIIMKSFKLYNSNNNEITDTRVITKKNDVNSRFSDKEFALFPMKRLDWNSSYRAKFEYTENGVLKEKDWSFKTKNTKYPTYIVSSNNEVFTLKSGKTYAIYIPPQDCNDSRYSYIYSYSASMTINKNDSIDANTLVFNLSGNIGDTLTFSLGSRDIVLKIASSDSVHLSADQDSDGMPDVYEEENGLNKDINDALLDKDNDGKSNIEEFNDGTNPSDENSKIYNLELNQGWSFVSLAYDSSLKTDDIKDLNIEIIRSYKNDKWYVWTKDNIVSNEEKLLSLEDGQGYWIKTKQNTVLNLKANGVASPANIDLNKWNMLGSKQIDNIDTFFSENPSIKIIWKYKDGQYYAVSSDSEISNDLATKNIPLLNEINSNEGFFVK